jgi:putative DNA primase/helicase
MAVKTRKRPAVRQKPTAAPEAELSWLAGLLEEVADDPPAAKRSSGSVEPSWFTVPEADRVLNAVRRVVDLPAPKLADVTARLRADSEDVPANGVDPGVSLVVELAKRGATSPHAFRLGMSRYADEMESAYWQREVVAKSALVASKAGDGTLTVEDVESIEQAAGRLRDVLDRKGAESRRLVLTPVSDIKCSPVNWLWPQRIVGDGLTIVTGPVGNTKSLFTIDVASTVSRGSRWPDGTGHALQGSVILFGAEDDAGKIVRPRLEAAGADLSRILVCEGTLDGTGSDPAAVVIEQHMRELRRALEAKPDCRLIVFDPLPDYISADENNSAEVRAAVMPLARLAQEKNVAVLAVLHQNKKTDLAAVQRIAGSMAFAQIARCVLAIGDHPEDGDADNGSKRRVMLVAKNNYGERCVGQAYRLIKRHGDQVGIEWIAGNVSMDADELTRRPNGGRHHDDRRADAVDALRQRLEAGEAQATIITTELQDAGFGRRQIDHAGNVLNVVKRRARDGWYWRLPARGTEDVAATPEPAFANFDLDSLAAFDDLGTQ